MATTLGCTAFGTLNGSALVTGSVFAKDRCARRCRRYGYNTNLTYGLIAASGNIGQFIPPSILIVIFGALSGDSYRPPAHGRHRPRSGTGDRLLSVYRDRGHRQALPVPTGGAALHLEEKGCVSLKNLIPIAIVAVVIIGASSFGICSSAEAGAIGCLVFFLMGLIKRTPFRRSGAPSWTRWRT